MTDAEKHVLKNWGTRDFYNSHQDDIVSYLVRVKAEFGETGCLMIVENFNGRYYHEPPTDVTHMIEEIIYEIKRRDIFDLTYDDLIKNIELELSIEMENDDENRK